MPSTENSASFITLAQTLVAAGVGAFVANLVAEIIKGWSRKSQSVEAARDEDLTRLLQMVGDLESLATDYWTVSGETLGNTELLLRSRIMAKQQHLLELIAHLFADQPKRDCDVVATELLDAVGGGDFGSPDRDPQPERLGAVFRHSLALSHLAKKSRRQLRRGWLA